MAVEKKVSASSKKSSSSSKKRHGKTRTIQDMGLTKEEERFFENRITRGFRNYRGFNKGQGWRLEDNEKMLSLTEYTTAAINANSTRISVVHAVGNGKLAPTDVHVHDTFQRELEIKRTRAAEKTSREKEHSSPYSRVENSTAIKPDPGAQQASDATSEPEEPRSKLRANKEILQKKTVDEESCSTPRKKKKSVQKKVVDKDTIKQEALQRIHSRQEVEEATLKEQLQEQLEKQLQAQLQIRKFTQKHKLKDKCYASVLDLQQHIPRLSVLIEDPVKPKLNSELCCERERLLESISLLTEWETEFGRVHGSSAASLRRLERMDGLIELKEGATEMVAQVKSLMLRAAELRWDLEDLLFLIEK